MGNLDTCKAQCLAHSKHSMNFPKAGEAYTGWALAKMVRREASVPKPSHCSFPLQGVHADGPTSGVTGGLTGSIGSGAEAGTGPGGVKGHQAAGWPDPRCQG